MNKVWNVDHYDYIKTVTDSDGHEVEAITKCEMEKIMNSYTTTQGTVKVVNPETNGQVRKYHVSFTQPHDTNQRTQHEIIAAVDEAQVRKAFDGCKDVVITSDVPHAVEEAYQMDVEALLDEGCGNDTADLLASMR